MKKKTKHNTADLWDKLWERSSKTQKEYHYNLLKEKESPVWKKIKAVLEKKFSGIEGLKVLELGAGRGFYSALLASQGAEVSILDYSENAIQKAREFFDYLGLRLQYVLGNALELEEELKGKFDVSMSFGLSEHFVNRERLMINKSHFDVLADNGLTFISVPNKYCLPYQIWKKKREILKKWDYGTEYPYSRNELRSICKKLQVEDYSFIGSPFFSSFNFIFPFSSWKNSLTKRFFRSRWLNPEYIRKPKETWLDQYFGYALILCAEKGLAFYGTSLEYASGNGQKKILMGGKQPL